MCSIIQHDEQERKRYSNKSKLQPESQYKLEL